MKQRKVLVGIAIAIFIILLFHNKIESGGNVRWKISRKKWYRLFMML